MGQLAKGKSGDEAAQSASQAVTGLQGLTEGADTSGRRHLLQVNINISNAFLKRISADGSAPLHRHKTCRCCLSVAVLEFSDM